MPELPEVETVVRTLRPILINRRIARVELTRTDIVRPQEFDLPRHLRGRTVIDITRRGKRIVFRLDNGNRFYVHLGMTGRLTVETKTAAIEKHTHMIINLCRPACQLRFRDPRRFGGVWWLGQQRDDATIGPHTMRPDTMRPDTMGPEPLTLRPAQLSRRLLRTRRAIKNVLLDQTVIAGLGNIYADEALFEAGIHPLTPANTLAEARCRRLSRAIKLILRRALRHRGSTLRDYVDANGDSGAFQNLHRVYARAAQPCRTCRTPISRIVLGGRSTHFCPTCQPAPIHPGASVYLE